VFFVKPLFKIAFAFAVMAMPPLQGEPTPSPSPSPTPFDVPIPVGMPVNGIKVPYYDETGRLAILIEADVAQKTDDTNVRLENLRLEALDEEERKILIELPKATLDLETRILSGDSSATIRREDFNITGDTIEFDTKNRFGTMRGNIRMVVNTENSTP
jgi:hypothetical protein